MRPWYPPTSCGEGPTPSGDMNIINTLYNSITKHNVMVDAASKHDPEVNPLRLPSRPPSTETTVHLPPPTSRTGCMIKQPSLQASSSKTGGDNHKLGFGLPLDQSDHTQQRHLAAHWMWNLPTTTGQAKWSANTQRDTTCLQCGLPPQHHATHDTAAPQPMSGSQTQAHEWQSAQNLAGVRRGLQAMPVRQQLWETILLEQWACFGGHAVHAACTQHPLLAGGDRSPVHHAGGGGIIASVGGLREGRTTPKRQVGPRCTMAWALQELKPHQQTEESPKEPWTG